MSEANGALTRRSLLKGAAALPMLATPAAALAVGPQAGMEIQRLAWAGVRLRIGDVALFVDAIAPNPQGGTPGRAGAERRAKFRAGDPPSSGPLRSGRACRPILGASDYVVAFKIRSGRSSTAA